MPGKISEDFASSLAKLHYKVDALEKANKQLIEQIEKLEQRIDDKDKVQAKGQRERALRAAFTQDKDEIAELKKRSDDIVEQELLRMFDPIEPMSAMPIQVNPELLANMQASMAGSKMPEMREVEVEVVVPYVQSQEYQSAAAKRAQDDMDAMIRDNQRRIEEQQKQQRKTQRNALSNRSSVWRTMIDDM